MLTPGVYAYGSPPDKLPRALFPNDLSPTLQFVSPTREREDRVQPVRAARKRWNPHPGALPDRTVSPPNLARIFSLLTFAARCAVDHLLLDLAIPNPKKPLGNGWFNPFR
jgi:hypothetical protein